MNNNEPPGPASAALYRLMAWLSPAYLVGGFSYSSGIGWAVQAGDIRDAATLASWLEVLIRDGNGFCAGDDAAIAATAELAAAFASGRERFLEMTAQGRAFFVTTRTAWPCAALERLAAAWDGPLAYPVGKQPLAVGLPEQHKPHCGRHEAAFRADLTGMRHETQYARLFRS